MNAGLETQSALRLQRSLWCLMMFRTGEEGRCTYSIFSSAKKQKSSRRCCSCCSPHASLIKQYEIIVGPNESHETAAHVAKLRSTERSQKIWKTFLEFSLSLSVSLFLFFLQIAHLCLRVHPRSPKLHPHFPSHAVDAPSAHTLRAPGKRRRGAALRLRLKWGNVSASCWPRMRRWTG